MSSGDTQALPSQELTSYLHTAVRTSSAWIVTPRSDTNDTGARTYNTGDTGHVNLVNNSGTPEPVIVDPEEEENSQVELEESQQNLDVVATSPVFLPPTTPGLAGHKRDHDGNIFSQPARTPAPDLGVLFAQTSGNAIMGLDAIFKQTQADSSPYLGAPRSDPIFERPSPDTFALRQSSLGPNASSPILPARPSFHRAITDPRNAYESMKESQERRKQAALTSLSPHQVSDDEDELGEDSEERRAARRRSTEKLKQEAMKGFASYGAPLPRRKVDKRRKIQEVRSDEEDNQDQAIAAEGDIIVISDDLRQEDADPPEGSSDEASVDQYDEYSQAVIPSDRNDEDRQDSPIEVPTTISRHNSQGHPRAASSPIRQTRHKPDDIMRRSFPETYRSQSSHASQMGMDGLKSAPQSQILAIADSQPNNSFHQRYLVPPPRPVLPSSINSRAFISQSQGFSLSSTTRVELAATPVFEDAEISSIPFPPALPYQDQDIETQDAGGEESPGSSPPVTAVDMEPDVDMLEQADEELPTNAIIEAHPVVQLDIDPTTVIPGELQQHSSQTTTSRVRKFLSQIIPETSPPTTPLSRENPNPEAPPQETLPKTRASPLKRKNQITAEVNDTNSNNQEHFGTAQTHQSNATPGTPKRLEIPRLTDIAAGFTPPGSFQKHFGEITIMNDDDETFHAAVAKSPSSSPPRKRMRRYGRRVLQEPAQEENTLHPLNSPVKLVPEVVAVPTPTPPSVKKREQMGAVAAASARLHMIAGADTPRVAGKLTRPTHRSKLVPQNESASAAKDNAARSVTRSSPRNKTWEKATSPSSSTIPGGNGNATTVEEPALQTSLHEPCEEINTAAAEVESPTVSKILVPNRVLAKFRGLQVACYPATCLDAATAKSTVHKIRFDDGTVDVVDSNFVRSFELQVGDVVKVDLPTLRTKSWVVRAFKDKISSITSEVETFPKTDIHGHQTVVLGVKQRQSLASDAEIAPSETIDVPMTNIYIPLSMFRHFKDRAYQRHNATARPETPTVAPSIPTTPSSRTRRHTLSAILHQSATESLSHFRSKGGIFANMAFAISYSSGKDTERNRVTRLIQDNGGCILTEGFEELFDVPVAAITSPSKASRTTGSVVQPTLTLLSSATRLGFTALIADSHSRRAKYMQALALNIPCLSGRWVVDSLAAEEAISWDRYLLPAGESSFLDGAVRSRTFPVQGTAHINCMTTKLSGTIEHRPKLLDEKSVILVMGEGKVEERRKAYLFLTMALGAKRIERVKGIKAAKTLLEKQVGEWDWVYVDDAKLKEAQSLLDGLVLVSETGSKKRKRESIERPSAEDGTKKAKLVGDEFVMQSLILGALLEDV